MRTVTVRLVVLGCALMALAGCGPAADGAYAGLTAMEPTDGTYRIWALAPPWKLSEGRVGRDVVELEIASNGERLAGPSMVPPKYALRINVMSGDAQRQAQRIADRTEVDDDVIGPRMFITDGGLEGWETIFFDISEGRHRRHSFLPSVGGLLHVEFEANPDLDDPEIDAMVATLEVGPFDAP